MTQKTAENAVGSFFGRFGKFVLVMAWLIPITICFIGAWGLRWCWESAKQGWDSDGYWGRTNGRTH